jgi:hypothetical protein
LRAVKPALKTSVAILLCAPLSAFCQHNVQELPFPVLKDVSIVVKMHYSFMPPLPSKGWSRDTESIFLVSPDGYIRSRYFSKGGLCSGKAAYEYSEGRLVRSSHYRSPDRHPLFSDHSAYSHPLTYENIWTYKAGKLFSSRHLAGPGRKLTREIRYAYDHDGRLTAEYHTYPPQSLIYYPTRYDAVLYEYDEDSVFKLQYVKGRLLDSFAYVERRNPAGLVTELWQISKDGMHYERALTSYDSANRIKEYQYFSDRPSVRPDGTVLSADKVEYTYDPLGRPDEVRYFARGIRRWSYKYEYLK